MADFVYMTNPAKIKEALLKIQQSGIPDKVTIKTLESLGFKSKNDRPLLGILKAIDFISSSGEPSSKWQKYRNKKIAPAVLAEGIRMHYSELFKIFPNAHQQDNEALRNFFGTHTKVSSGTLDHIVRTFKTLTEMADFTSEETSSEHEIQPISSPVPSVHSTLKQNAGYTVNINIQLTLPENAKPETFEAFFQAMKKHLL